MIRVLNVCGARPNFMKVAPLMRAYRSHPEFAPILVHTGQHYDEKMSDLFFRQLGIPEPDLNLGVGSGSHSAQTAAIMIRFEPVVLEHNPDWIVVVGDVNSTVACSLVAAKLGVQIAHVEAGLRSNDRSMPEEINRVLTDALSDLLFVTERAAIENLQREGIDRAKIHFVGNVMIDTLLEHRLQADGSSVLRQLALEPQRYAVVTLHRPSNVDDPNVLASILEGLMRISHDMPVVFAAHPRTQERFESFGLQDHIRSAPDLKVIEPLGYLDFLKLMSEARVVLTDSGGMQEETTILKVPCMTLRKNTERPVTVSEGTNRLVDPDSQSIQRAWAELRDGKPWGPGKTPELWDGRAAERIVDCLYRSRSSHRVEPERTAP